MSLRNIKAHCSHCQLEYEVSELKEVKVDSGDSQEGLKSLYFCCNGCESVYFLLQEAHLQSFYDKLTSPIAPPIYNQENDLLRFDTQGFAQKYIHSYKPQKSRVSSLQLPLDSEKELSEVRLVISGIHCVACIWLNEKLLLQQDGIESVSINYTNNKATIIWDRDKLALSQIIALIRSIGYDAYPYDSKLQEHTDVAQMREYYARVIVALFCTMNIMWVAVAQYSGYFLGIDEDSKDILNIASFVLCTPALFYSGWVFYRSSYFGLKQGFIGMDLLVAVGSTLTYVYSIYAALTRSGETYFESVSMIITFVLIGKFLEVRARKNAGDNLDRLSNLLPTSVELCKDGDMSKTCHISPEEVRVGDVLLARAGEKIAVDGILLSQNAVFDTQVMSGEMLPLESKKGEEIFSGYVNLNHQILYQATREFSQSMMSSIVEIVSASLSHRPQIQNLANSLSQYFSRTILSIAIVCFLGWYFLGEIGVERSLMIAISVIIIACPCALALATPIASVVGIGQAYSHNILFRQAKFLENLAKASVVVFDKTGTLTQGTPKVQANLLNGTYDKSELLSFVSLSKHPVALGVAEYLQDVDSQTEILDSVPIEDSENSLKASVVLENFTQHHAQGITASVKGDFQKIVESGADRMLVGGSLEFLSSLGFSVPEINLGDGMVFAYGVKSSCGECEILEIFEVYDKPKPHARELIESLHARGISTILLSGDREPSVRRVANELGVEQALSSLSPLQKAQWIESYKDDKPQSMIVMVGDGINDAPALSRSDVAISMGAGSDIAILSSDVIILDDRLETLDKAFEISYRTFQGIKQNIMLSIGYNILSVPLAIAGLVIPLVAALFMSVSSLIVVLNSLRLRHKGV